MPGLFFFGELGQARPGSAAASWSARAEHRILNEKGSADCADIRRLKRFLRQAATSADQDNPIEGNQEICVSCTWPSE